VGRQANARVPGAVAVVGGEKEIPRAEGTRKRARGAVVGSFGLLRTVCSERAVEKLRMGSGEKASEERTSPEVPPQARLNGRAQPVILSRSLNTWKLAVLYKYLSPARIDVLQNLKIRFTQPYALNDPFESALLLGTKKDIYAEWEVEMERMARELNPETEEDHANLEQAKVFLREEARKMVSPQIFGQQLIKRLNKSQGVLSLSRTNDSLLMWSHYGDSHKGYVIGLDDSHQWFYETNGLGKPTKPNNVIYTSRRSPVIAGTDDFHDRLLCYKSLEWAYEQEVRIFRTFGSTKEQFDKNSIDALHLFDIPRECIKEIHIGANADEPFRKQIIDAAQVNELDVPIYEAFVDDERYALNFRQVAV
jgi:hypothetical protein